MEPLCSSSQEVLLELEAAIEEHSLYDVLRCLCEATHHGVDLTDPLPSSVSSSIVFFGVTLNLFAIKSPWNKYALINMPSRNMLAENCPAEKTPLT